MEFLLFVLLILAFIWIGTVSSRLSKIERGGFIPGQIPNQMPPRPISEMSVPVPASVSSQMPAAPIPPKLELRPQRTEAEVEALTSRTLTIIGVVALIIGIGFFMKLAIDNGWISEWGRIIIGLIVGLLLVALGEIWKDKYAKYAQALSGGGLAIIYFSIYAANQFYDLISKPVALAIMLLVNLVSVLLASRYKSKLLALLGIAGAYLAPLIIYTNGVQEGPLFAYLIILSIISLVICLRMLSIELLALSLVGTALNIFAWSTFASLQNVLVGFVFLIAIALIYFLGIGAVVRKHAEQIAKGNSGETDAGVAIVIALSGLFFFVAEQLFFKGNALIQFNGSIASLLALLTLCGALIVFVAYTLIDRLNFVKTNYTLSLAGAFYLVAAACWQFTDLKALSLVLIILGAIGAGIGLAVKRAELRIWSILISYLAIIVVLTLPSESQFLLNPKFGLVILETLVLIVIGRMYRNTEQSGFEKDAQNVLLVTASLLLWLGVCLEIFNSGSLGSDNFRNLMLSVWSIVYAVLLVMSGAVPGWKYLRKVAVGLFGLSIVKVFLFDVANLDLAYRIISFITLGVLLLAVSFAYQRNKDKVKGFLS